MAAPEKTFGSAALGDVMKGFKFIPDDTNFNFLGMKRIAFALSLLTFVAAIYFIAGKGLNLGIDFTGGTVLEIKTPTQPDLATLRKELNGLGIGAISIQEFGEPDDLLIRMPGQEGEAEAQKAALEKVRSTIDAQFPDAQVDYRRTEFVGPQVGEELKKQGLFAVFASILGIMAYVWLRFEWQFGVTALIALAHDAVTTVGLFAMTGLEFNLSTVAAILMVAGYSVNDTVVVFDRIRENLRKYKKMPMVELLNKTVNQTLSRTTMTSFTTLLALIALYMFGGEVIRGFVVALIFGIVVGTYSSIYVAAPLLLYMNLRGNIKKSKNESSDEES
jgi:preprotein translocase SecF subunit